MLVAKSKNIIYQKSFGYKDKDSKYLLTNNSMFEIGLLTNQFTAVGILLLKDRVNLNSLIRFENSFLNYLIII